MSSSQTLPAATPPERGSVLFLSFITAKRLGACVEGPFDQDNSSFCVTMDSICSTISAELLQTSSPRRLPIRRDPSRWSKT